MLIKMKQKNLDTCVEVIDEWPDDTSPAMVYGKW